MLMNRSLEAIRRTPGVMSAGATTTIPLGGDYEDSVILAEGYAMKPGESVISPRRLSVTPGYLETMGVSLLRGRYFQESDDRSSPLVVIVDERLARRFWPNSDPVGQRMYEPDPTALAKIGPALSGTESWELCGPYDWKTSRERAIRKVPITFPIPNTPPTTTP